MSDALEAERLAHEATRAELEQYRMRLAGALTAADGYFTRAMRDEPDTVEYVRTCPTIDTVIRRQEEATKLRSDLENARARIAERVCDGCGKPPTVCVDCSDLGWASVCAERDKLRLDLDAAHARIAELTEAFTKFRSLTHQFTRGGIDRCADCGRLGVSKVDSKDHSPECEVAEAYAVYDAALTTSDTPRGLGPAGTERVREALEAWRDSLAPTNEAAHPERLDEPEWAEWFEQDGPEQIEAYRDLARNGGKRWRMCTLALAALPVKP